jgi:hypothetical protein
VGVSGAYLGEWGRWKDPWRGQAHRVEAHRVLDIHGRKAEMSGKAARCSANLIARGLLVLESPTPVLTSTNHPYIFTCYGLSGD